MTDEYLRELDRLLSEPMSSVRDRGDFTFDSFRGISNRAGVAPKHRWVALGPSAESIGA